MSNPRLSIVSSNIAFGNAAVSGNAVAMLITTDEVTYSRTNGQELVSNVTGSMKAGNVEVSGSLRANADGLYHIPAGNLVGTITGNFSGNADALYSLNASNISTGTLSNARLPASIAVSNISANADALFSLNASNISTGILGVARGGTGVSTSTGSGNVVLNVSPTLQGLVTINGTLAASNVSGNADALFSLNASNIATGTLSNALLPSSIAVSNISANADALYSLNASNISTGTLSNARLPSSIAVSNISANADALFSLNASNIATGTLAVARGGTGVSTSTGSGNVVLNVAPTFQGLVTMSGNLATSNVSGNGAGLSGLNASNLVSGTVSNSLLPASISVSNVSGNGAGLSSLNLANTFGILGVNRGGTGVTTSTGSGNVVLNVAPTFQGPVTISGTLAASNVSGNADALFSLNASNISTGIVGVARGGTGVSTSTGSGNVVLNVSPTLQGLVTISGTLAASNVSANADALFSLNASNISTGILGVARGGTGVTTSTGSGNVVLNVAPTFQGLVTMSGNLAASNVSGNADALYSLNASNIATGTLSNARLPSSIAVSNISANGAGISGLNASNLVSGTVSNSLLPSSITVANLSGNGAGLSGLNASNLVSGTVNNSLLPSSITVANLAGNGAGLSSLNLANTYGTLGVARGGTGVTTSTGSGNVVLNVAPTFQGPVTISGNLAASNVSGNADALFSLNASNISTGIVGVARGGTGVSTSTGSGNVVLNVSPTLQGLVTISGNLAASNVSANADALFSLNASNISTGTLSNARLPSSIAVSNISANADALFSLNASNISTGTLSNARLPSSIAVSNISANADALYSLNASNISTGILGVARGGTGVSTSTGSGNVVLNVAPTFQGLVNMETAYVRGNLRVSGNLVIDTGNVAYINSQTILSNQMVITNDGTGPALRARQNALQPVAEFMDDANVVFKLYDAGYAAFSFGNSAALATNTPPSGNLVTILGNLSANLSANDIVVGTLSNARLPASISVSNISANADALFSLNASNIATGTLSNARLPASIAVSNISANADALYSLNASNISTGTLAVARGGTGVSTSTGSGNVVLNVAPTFQGLVTINGNLATSNVSGNGAGLSGLNASNLVSGTVSNSLLPSSIAVSNLSGNGAGLSGLNASNLVSGTVSNSLLPSSITVANLAGNGAGLSSLNLANTYGTLGVARGGTGVSTSTGSGNVVLNVSPTLQGLITINGTLAASNVSGNADALFSLNASNISTGTLSNARLPSSISVSNISANADALFSLNASNISTGTLSNARLPSSIAVSNISANGDALFSLNASNIATGTLSNARLPASIAVSNISANADALYSLNASNIATGILGVARGGTGVSTSTGSGNVVLNVAPTFQGLVTISGTLAASNVSGNADALFSLNASNIATGTLSNARLPSSIAVSNISANADALFSLNASNISTGTLSNARLPSSIAVSNISANADALFSLNASNIATGTLSNARLPASISVSNISANADALYSLNASNISTGILGVARGGTGVSTSTGSGNVVLNVAPTFQGLVTINGNLAASNVSGNGAGLGDLNASNLVSGTVSNSLLPASIAVANLAGNGAGLSGLNASNLVSGTVSNSLLPSSIAVGNLSGNGAGLSSLNLANTYGTLAVDRGGTGVSTSTGSGNVVLNVAPVMQGNVTISGTGIFESTPSPTQSQLHVRAPSGALGRSSVIRMYSTFGGTGVDVGTRYVSSIRSGFLTYGWADPYVSVYVDNGTPNDGELDSGQNEALRIHGNGNVVVTANLTAQYLFGNGAFLTGVVTGGSGFDGNASNITSGTLDTARLPSNISTGNLTASGNVSATYVLGNGAFLTGVVTGSGFDGNASNITSGTLSNARLPSNISVANLAGNGAGLTSLNLANVYGTLAVASGGTGVTTSTGSGNLVLNVSPTFQGIVTVTGNVNASNVSGNGSGLSGLNASNLVTGTVSNSLLPANISVANLSGNGAGISSLNLANVYGTLAVASGGTGVTTSTGSGNLVLNVSPTFQGTMTTANVSAGNLTATGNVSATYVLGNGALLTGINGFDGNASNITSGTLSNSRLPAIISVSNVEGNGYGLSAINAANVVGNLTDLELDFSVGSIPANALYGTIDADVVLTPGSVDASVNIANIGDWIPAAANTYTLGNAAYPWKDIFLGTSSVYLGNTVIINSPVANVFTVSTSGSEKVRINASGNVGIGNINPSYKLHVSTAGTGGQSLGLFESNVDVGTGFVDLGVQNSVSSMLLRAYGSGWGGPNQYLANAVSVLAVGSTKRLLLAAETGDINFSSGGSYTAPQMSLTAGGVLWFGDRVNNNMISLYGNSTSQANTTSTYGFGINASTLRYNSGGNHYWYTNTTTTMGVEPTGTFFIAGQAYKPGGGSWVASSDARVKEQIELANAHQCWDAVKALPLKRFAYTAEFLEKNPSVEDQHVVGWIADDVQAVFPKAVKEKDLFGYTALKTLDADQLLKTAYGALGMAIARIEALEAQVQTLL